MPITSVPLCSVTHARTFASVHGLSAASRPYSKSKFSDNALGSQGEILIKQTALLSLLALAIATTTGCGTSTAAPSANTFTKVAFMSNRTVTPFTNMFAADLDGANVTPIPRTATSLAPSRYLSMSADSKTAAFVAYNGVFFVIGVGGADGTGQKALTTPGGNVNHARISPSGKQIVYDDNTQHVLVINADGTGNLDLTPTLPANTTSCADASFSADSSLVVFTCSGTGYGIYTIKADGTGLKTVEVRANNAFVRSPWLTPDGKKILFHGNLGANSDAVVSVNIDGTGETLVVTSATELVILNTTLFYEYTCTGSPKIYKANLDGTNPVQVTDGTNNDDLYLLGSCA